MTSLFGPGKPKRIIANGKDDRKYANWGRGIMNREESLDRLLLKLSIFYISDPRIYLGYWSKIIDMWVIWRGLVKIEEIE